MNYKQKVNACNRKIELYKKELDLLIHTLTHQMDTHLDLQYEIKQRLDMINLLRDKIEDLQPWWRKLFKVYYFGS